MDIHDQVLNAFQVEHKEQLERIRSILSTLEKDAAAPHDPRWEEAFRMAHTLKGGARVCDLRELEQLGHRMESLFSSVREGSLQYDKNVADTLIFVLDAIEDWMAALVSSGAPEPPEQALAAIEQLLKEARSTPHSVSSPSSPPSPTAAPAPSTPTEAVESRIPFNELDSVRVRTEDLDAVLRSADELLTLAAGHDRLAVELTQLRKMVQTLVSECESVRTNDAGPLRRLSADPQFSRISRHVDSVVQQARRMAKKERQVRAIQQGADWSLGVLAESLRRDVHRTRMVSAENVFQGLRSMVRSLARDVGKEVEFTAVGLDTQADRRVLQALKDPLMHVLRNAIAHGIEPPDQRAAKGKPPQGEITLRLGTQGNLLELVVEDDGRGIDLPRVAQEASRRGLLPNSDSAQFDSELSRLLFQPGFTTSSVVNELAGRGMGLSVVQATASRLLGTAELRNRQECGAALSIRVPLSISAQRLLMVIVSERIFAIPTHGIDRVLHIKPNEVKSLEGRSIVNVEGFPIPYIRMDRVLGLERAEKDDSNGSIPLVVLQGAVPGRLCAALAVNAFVAEREALIKELDRPAASAKHFTGAVLLDDGGVALVLNTTTVVEDAPAASTSDLPAHSSDAPKSKHLDRSARILIVDDSFTTRTLEKNILEANGYDVHVAVDGFEALNHLRTEPMDLVISDVEMPRMDGFTMLKEIKADPQLSHLPVLLVTSMDRHEDQERGLTLGADAYIVKRKFDHQELLGTIKRFL